jgi:anti-sigma B factor antagonist
VSLEPFPVLRDDDVAVVTLPAEVDISTSDLLRGVLLAAIDGGPAVLIVDMSATVFCDSAGLSALIVAHRQAGTAGTRLRLVATEPAVLRILSITGVDRLISLYPTLAAARAGSEPAPERVPE